MDVPLCFYKSCGDIKDFYYVYPPLKLERRNVLQRWWFQFWKRKRRSK